MILLPGVEVLIYVDLSREGFFLFLAISQNASATYLEMKHSD